MIFMIIPLKWLNFTRHTSPDALFLNLCFYLETAWRIFWHFLIFSIWSNLKATEATITCYLFVPGDPRRLQWRYYSSTGQKEIQFKLLCISSRLFSIKRIMTEGPFASPYLHESSYCFCVRLSLCRVSCQQRMHALRLNCASSVLTEDKILIVRHAQKRPGPKVAFREKNCQIST